MTSAPSATTPDLAYLTASVDFGTIEAAAPGESPKPLKFTMLAYSGASMRVAGFRDPVVIDLGGLDLGVERLPILADHMPYAEFALGHTTEKLVKDGQLHVAGVLSGTGETLDRVVTLARNGFPWQGSVGLAYSRVERVEAGQSVNVNGRTVSGPVNVIRASRLREVSFVVLGADDGTVSRVAATARTASMHANNENPPAADAILAERERVREIHSAFLGLGQDRRRDELIERGASVSEARAEALGLLRASRPPLGSPAVMVARSEVDDRASLAASAARLLGATDAAISAAKLPPPGDRGPRSLMELAERCVRLDRGDAPHSRDELIRAAFSTDSFSPVLRDALRVVAIEGFRASDEPALRICKEVPVPDFRETTLARLEGNFKYRQVTPSGSITHGVIDGNTTKFQLATHGLMITLNRQQLINDERSLLQQIPSELGAEAARTIGDRFAAALLETAGFFDAGNNNLMSGGSSALSITSLTEAVRRLRVQADKSGRALNLAPKYLLVPPALEATARQLLNSAELGRTDGGPTANPMRGIAELLVDARLAPASWYLFADAMHAPAILANLNGQNLPVVEAVDLEADVLGVGWRAFHDFAIALHEPRAAVRAVGS